MVHEKVKRGFEAFCSGTSLHGFMELFNAKNIFWRSFWVILLSAALGLTTYQVIRSINQFMDQSSNTRNEPVVHLDMYPPLKLCSMHWVYWVDWEKAFSMKFTKQAVLYGMAYLTAIYTEDTFDIETTKKQFQYAMALNNFTKIQQFYLGIARDYQNETVGTQSPLLPSQIFDQRQIFLSRYWQTIMCYITKPQSVMDTIDRNNVTEYAELVIPLKMQRDSLKGANITSLEYVYYMSHALTGPGLYEDSNKNFSFRDFSTFSLPYLLFIDGYSQDYVPIKDEDDIYTIIVKIDVNRWRPGAGFKCLVNHRFIRSNKSICPDCKSLYPDNSCPYQWTFDAISSNTDYPESLLQNRILHINNEHETMIYPGTLSQQRSCQGNETVKLLQKTCSDACVYPCEQWVYSFTYVIEKFGTATARDYLTKKFTIIRVVYPNDGDVFIMVEVENQTWEDFVANIGGLLGVWTGASLLSAIQLFYLCCFSQMDAKCSFPKRKKDDIGDVVKMYG